MPSASFINELNLLDTHDLARILARWVVEGSPDPKQTAALLTTTIYDALPRDEEEEIPQLLKVADFMEAVGEPPAAIVPNFLPAKRLILLSGAAKEGKSLVALEFLHCLSIGGSLMGKYPIEQPGVVAYFGLEDGGFEIKERLRQRGIIDIDNFYICWNSFDMGAPAGFETFKRLTGDLPEQPILVVIDTAREAFRSIRDWNDAALVGPVISPLRRWAHKNCTVILVTHNNKNQFATGVNKIAHSGALVSSCDSYMILENQKVLDNGNLRWDWEEAGRGVKHIRCVLEMDTNDLHIRILDGADKQKAVAEEHFDERRGFYEKVAILIDASEEGQHAHAISEELQVPIYFARRLIQEMVSRKEAERTGKSVRVIAGAGKAAPLYILTPKGALNYLQTTTYVNKDGVCNSVSTDPDEEEI